MELETGRGASVASCDVARKLLEGAEEIGLSCLSKCCLRGGAVLLVGASKLLVLLMRSMRLSDIGVGRWPFCKWRCHTGSPA